MQLKSFVERLSSNDLDLYWLEVCKVDASCSKSDEEIGKSIWEMSVRKYGLVKEDYIDSNGLHMLTKGKNDI